MAVERAHPTGVSRELRLRSLARQNLPDLQGSVLGQGHRSIKRAGFGKKGPVGVPTLLRSQLRGGQLLHIHVKKGVGQLGGVGGVERVVGTLGRPYPILRTPSPRIPVHGEDAPVPLRRDRAPRRTAHVVELKVALPFGLLGYAAVA